MGVSLVGENSFYQFAGLRVGNQLSDVPQVAVTDDSEFYIKGVGPGTYTLTCTVPPDLASTWRVRSAMVDGPRSARLGHRRAGCRAAASLGLPVRQANGDLRNTLVRIG
jgi:hypothetical protein